MEPWTTTDRQVVFQPDGGRFVTIENHQVALPSGQVIEDWVWIDTPAFVNVLVQTADEDYLIFRQTKYAVDGVTLAVVGGYIEQGEDPAVAARREVIEETGWQPDTLTPLGAYAMDGNRGSGIGHLFVASGATPATEKLPSDDLEEQELVRVSRQELRDALLNGEFKIASWAATVAMALLL